MNLCKIIRDTNIWRKGQKVWVIGYTGDLSYRAMGRFRGKGHWCVAWIHTDGNGCYTRHKPDCKWIGEVEVTEKFYKNLITIIDNIKGYSKIYTEGF
jgi:hypothetical protein